MRLLVARHGIKISLDYDVVDARLNDIIALYLII